MKKNNIIKYIIAILLTGLFFSSCGVDPSTITLNSPEELVNLMNTKFEGNFTYKSHESNEKNKFIKVMMSCEVDNTTLEVYVSESHKSDYSEFGTYYHKNGTYYTNYYAARYGEKAAESMKSLIKDHFENIAELPGFKIIAYPDKNITDLVKLDNLETYMNYIKENGILSYAIIVPAKKDENKNFELLYLALANNDNFSWLNSSTIFIYDSNHQITDEILKLSSVELENLLIESNIDFKYK